MEGSRLKITGAWTKAGIASCVHVQGSQRNENFLFDCGFMNSDTTYAKYVFISHGHIDHVGCCINHARAKSLSGSLAIYYVPHDILPHLIAAKEAFERLDESTIPMNIIGVGPDDEIVISPTLKVNVFATLHRVPSQGYAISTIKKGELLPELRNMTGKEIGELKMMGQTIYGPETEELEMVYTGDTTMAGLLQLGAGSRVFQSHTFITEVTYLDGDRSKAAQYGHVHVQDIVDHAHLFRNVTYLVIVHISQKYSVSRVIKLLKDQLPGWLLSKVLVSLHSFGAREHLTRLVDERWERQEQSTAGWGWSNHRAQRSYQQYAQGVDNVSAVVSVSSTGGINSAAQGITGAGAAGGAVGTASAVERSVSGGTSSSMSGIMAEVGHSMALLATSRSTDTVAVPAEVITLSSSDSGICSAGSGGTMKYSDAVRSSTGTITSTNAHNVSNANWDSMRKSYTTNTGSSSGHSGGGHKKKKFYGGKHGVNSTGYKGSSANISSTTSNNWHKKSMSRPYKQAGQVYQNNSA